MTVVMICGDDGCYDDDDDGGDDGGYDDGDDGEDDGGYDDGDDGDDDDGDDDGYNGGSDHGIDDGGYDDGDDDGDDDDGYNDGSDGGNDLNDDGDGDDDGGYDDGDDDGDDDDGYNDGSDGGNDDGDDDGGYDDGDDDGYNDGSDGGNDGGDDGGGDGGDDDSYDDGYNEGDSDDGIDDGGYDDVMMMVMMVIMMVVMVNNVATAESTAVPPFFSIFTPISEHIPTSAATAAVLKNSTPCLAGATLNNRIHLDGKMSELSETDGATDISQSSREDSGIPTSFGGSVANEESLNQDDSQASCSDVLAELFQSHKRLRETETQVRSLSLILEHGNGDDASSRIDQVVFEENKSSLEEEIMKIKQEICDKELVLQQRDTKLFEYYLGSIKDETNSKFPAKLSQNEGSINSIKGIDNSTLTWLNVCQNEGVKNLNGREYLPDNVEIETSEYGLEGKNKSWDDYQYFESSSDKEHEIAKLRRALAETKQKHKEERDEIMKQLKALQITTVHGETNWRCVLKEKQLKIDELTRKNSELQTKHAEVSSRSKNCEKLREKERKESDRRKRKDDMIILSLRTQNEEMKQLLSEVDELRNIKQELNVNSKQLAERNKELQKDLCDKNQTLDEKNRIVEEYSKEIKETNILVNQLVMDVNSLNTDKENLNKQIEVIKTENIKNLEQIKNNILEEEQLNLEVLDNTYFVHVDTQTEENAYQLNDELQRVKAELELKQGENVHLAEQLQKQESFLEGLKENEVKLEKQFEIWKNKSLQKERTIQELTFSLGKASCERQIEKYEEIQTETKGEFADFLIGILLEIKEEMNGVEEDFRKHKDNVCSLQKTWRKFKNSFAEMKEVA
ncbi:Hypothetical predicted protein [Paramuricea clavata]|uniref:Uncharacterized protein n=1 Tax=Paramuricea clavata TaxID=317549 RepID=A0A7D9DJV6_PARCT|nr:Hypothetical predicted protein [Paramuricea clavata]